MTFAASPDSFGSNKMHDQNTLNASCWLGYNLRIRMRGHDSGFRAQSSGVSDLGLRFWVESFGFWVLGFGFRI
jgi:hypothetical protein